jgi:hypothetical protein
MTSNIKPKPYRLRLMTRFGFYDEHGSHMWREWPEGAVVTDQRDIKLLETRDAPIEIIEPLEIQSE